MIGRRSPSLCFRSSPQSRGLRAEEARSKTTTATTDADAAAAAVQSDWTLKKSIIISAPGYTLLVIIERANPELESGFSLPVADCLG